ncbi:MAG: hypothetical protein ABUS47_13390 [Steroidobacter sp.]
MPGGTSVQSGTAATLGDPSSTPYNGLLTVRDPAAHIPKHGVDAAAAALPAALATESKPYIPSIKILARRDTILLYFPNVAGAADYRAYAVSNTNGVTFASTSAGVEPRGAVIACAGYSQHSYEMPMKNGMYTRELQQAIELPGFTSPGDYTIILEAIKTPCPYPGSYGHTDATFNDHDPTTTASSRLPAGGEYTDNVNLRGVITSFETMRKKYGNEIINGKASLVSYPDRVKMNNGVPDPANGPDIGLPVPANDPTIPADPVVIARSAVAVRMPFFDESFNAPVFDVGPNSFFDDFSNDYTVPPSDMGYNSEFHGPYAISTTATIPGAWAFWSQKIQHADQNLPGGTQWDKSTIGSGMTNNYIGLQIFQRHGRLYTTFGDYIEDNPGALEFSSLRNLPLQLDNTKYAHSFFRVNSDASQRRYWTWVICGASSPDQLVDMNTHMPLIHPVITQYGVVVNADNPSAKIAADQPASTTRYNKECLSVIQLGGRPEAPRTDGNMRTSSTLTAQIYSAGYSHGIITLGNAHSDVPVAGDSPLLNEFRWKTDDKGNYMGPVIDPFDQTAPLTHYDIFLRRNRLLVFVNGRQALCADLSDMPLSMNYGLVVYGSLIYHSALEWQENERSVTAGALKNNTALYDYQLNAPIVDSRVWDAIGESDMIDVPSQFSTYNESYCIKPKDLTRYCSQTDSPAHSSCNPG